MNQISFWETWSPTYKRTLFAFLAVAFASFVLLWISYFQSPAPTIATERFQQLETQEIALHTFSFAGISLSTTGDNFILFEHIKGGLLTPNRFAAYLFVGLLAMAAIVLLSIITTLSRFWYFLGMGLFILFIVGFRFETTYLFNLANKIPTVIILTLYGALSYYFHSFNRNVRFQLIVASFSGITLMLFLALFFFSKTKDPFMHLAANGMFAGVILSIVFILTVAHEILAFFINVISRGVKQTKSLRHFTLISAIYLVNLALTFAGRKGYIDWDFLTVNLFFLLSISAILGLWGFRQRGRLYANILQADPLGCYLFISLAVICFATITYFLATANDPPLQLLQDTIIYSHIGYGVIFVCYVLANFSTMLAKNQQVHKILYNPNSMPYFSYRFAGLIATFGFFAYSVYSVSVHQLFAGYYDANADAYYADEDIQTAESYYNQSLLYSNRNHHAHYALASIEAQRYELRKEKKHYELAADTRPTEFSYLNLSLAQNADGENLQSNNTLLQGLKDFPTSDKLRNALGLSYAKLGLRDSAILSLEKAKQSFLFESIAETNLIGVMAKFKFPFPADSLNQLVSLTEKGAKSNALALANQQKISITLELPTQKDSSLTLYEATLLNNYVYNHFSTIDTTLVRSIITAARRQSNRYFKASLLEAAANSYYSFGETQKAFKLLAENAFFDRNGKMYNTLGLWALEQGNAELALAQFDFALDQKFKAAQAGKAIAISELGNEIEAKAAWQELLEQKDTIFQAIASSFIKVYSTTLKDMNLLDDLQKYQFSHFRVATYDLAAFNAVVNSTSDTEYKARAIFDRSKKFYELDEPQAAANTIAMLQGIPIKNKILYNQIIEFNLQLLASVRDYKTLKEQFSVLPASSLSEDNKLYFEALLAAAAGNTAEAKLKFEWLATGNSFNEEATIDGINSIRETAPDKLAPFNILVNATSINPGSVKLLKAYIIEAAKLGFDDYAQESLDKLKPLISPANFNKFIKANPEVFQVIPN